MVKELLFLPLYEQFIKETANGKRRKLNGERIKPQTVANYTPVLKLLNEYESFTGAPLRIKVNIRNNVRLLLRERNYWRAFYRKFSDFLHYEKGYFDNFTGFAFKNIKSAFRYLKNEKCVALQEFYESFYIREENISIISLLPEQYVFLIQDKEFELKLTNRLRITKDMFVFGCSTALRYSDLLNIRVKDIEVQPGGHFLNMHTLKTGTEVNIKLPSFAVEIFKKYSFHKGLRQKLFGILSLSCFNKNLKRIGQLAGWTNSIGKYRSKDGEKKEIKTETGKLFRFCDLLSSHVMRRTGITVLLMLEMPEYLVRKLSGHTANSASFFRYVNFVQSFITKEIDKAHQKLLSLYGNISH